MSEAPQNSPPVGVKGMTEVIPLRRCHSVRLANLRGPYRDFGRGSGHPAKRRRDRTERCLCN
jgi:hypothetical protein